jgi:hypothetical protein
LNFAAISDSFRKPFFAVSEPDSAFERAADCAGPVTDRNAISKTAAKNTRMKAEGRRIVDVIRGG